MSGKLDKSLDELLTSRRAGARRRPQRRASGRNPAPTAPVGGVQKSSKAPRTAATKQAGGKGAPLTGDSKIIVSNLVCVLRRRPLDPLPLYIGLLTS